MNISAISGIAKVVAALGAGGVLAGAIALGATGGTRGGDASPPQAQIPDETPTSVVEGTAMPETPDVINDRFDPSDIRDDCPSDWASYVDPEGRFSLCHPKYINPVTERPADSGLGLLLSLGEPVSDPRHPENIFAITISWSIRSSFVSSKPSVTECTRDTGTTSAVTKASFVSDDISGRDFEGCDWRGRRGSLASAGEMKLEVPFSRSESETEGFIRIRVDYVGPDLDGTFARAQQLLETVRLP